MHLVTRNFHYYMAPYSNNYLQENKLILGSVFSMPKGLSQDKIRDYIAHWVKPYLKIVYSYPKIPFVLYISGSMLEIFEKHSKEVCDVLLELIVRKQVELLGGTYYDSAPLIQPKADLTAQVEKLSFYIQKRYKYRVSGLWVTPGTYDHASLDVFHNSSFLISERAYLEPLPTQNQLGILELNGAVLPVLTYDVYNIHSLIQDPQQYFETITLHRRHGVSSNMGNSVNSSLGSSLGDGAYFQSSHSLYLKHPVLIFAEAHQIPDKKQYFESLTELCNVVSVARGESFFTQPSVYCKAHSGMHSPCRIRTTPYGEESFDSFSHYIATRVESRLLYGKLQYVTMMFKKFRADKVKKQSLKLHIWEAQGHFGYWSSEREWGFDDPQFRQYIYKILLEAEVIIRDTTTATILQGIDYNLDGQDEVYFSSNFQNVLVTLPSASIALWENKRKKRMWNYLSTMVPHATPRSPAFYCKDYALDPETKGLTVQKNILNNSSDMHETLMYTLKKLDKRGNTVTYATQIAGIGFEKQIIFRNRGGFKVEYSRKEQEKDMSHLSNHMFGIELNVAVSQDKKQGVKILCGKQEIAWHRFSAVQCNTLQFVHYQTKDLIKIDINKDCTIFVAPVCGLFSLIEDQQTLQHVNCFLLLPIKSVDGLEINTTISPISK